jgi:hypothetical protein
VSGRKYDWQNLCKPGIRSTLALNGAASVRNVEIADNMKAESVPLNNSDLNDLTACAVAVGNKNRTR